jgi:hypothetical protein
MAGSDKFGVKEVLDVTFYDTVTNKPVLFCDTLKVSTMDVKASQVFARGGKGNPKLLIWDFDKEISMAVTDALMSPKSFQLLSGNIVTTGTQKIYMRQDTDWMIDSSDVQKMIDKGALYPLTATGAGAITLAFTPNEVASDILVYEVTDDGGTPLVAGTLSGKILTNIAWASKKLVAYYSVSQTGVQTYLITSSNFPGSYRIVGDTSIRNARTLKDESFQLVINNAKVQSNFKFEFKADGDPSAFDMNLDILKETSTDKMVTMSQYANNLI